MYFHLFRKATDPLIAREGWKYAGVFTDRNFLGLAMLLCHFNGYHTVTLQTATDEQPVVPSET